MGHFMGWVSGLLDERKVLQNVNTLGLSDDGTMSDGIGAVLVDHLAMQCNWMT